MNPSGPSFVPFLFFLGGYTRSQRVVFLLLLTLLALSSGLYLFTSLNPTYFPVTIAEVAQSQQAVSTVEQVTYQYRDYALQLPVFHQTVTFAASPLQVQGWMLFAFTLVQLLGWAAGLATASLMQSRWSYVVYGLFAIWLHFTQVFTLILPGDNAVAVELLLQVLTLGLAYAFQQNMIRVPFLTRFLALTAILMAAFGYVWFTQGYPGLHESIRAGFPFLAFLALPFLVFIGKEPLALLFYVATNQRDTARRMPLPMLVGIAVLWLLSTVFMLAPFFSRGAEIHQWIKPSILATISAVLTVFLSQNLYKLTETVFKQNFVFTMLLVSWGLITMSHLALSQGRGGFVYVFDAEGIMALAFAGVGLGYLIFVTANHLPLLRMRANSYFALAKGTKFGFFTVWLISAIPIVFGLGSTGWRTLAVVIGEQLALDGDQAFMAGDNKAAVASYRAATQVLPAEVRSNYNYACLLAVDPNNAQLALERFRKSCDLIEFAPARINAGNIFMVSETPKGAIRELAGNGWQAPYYQLNNLGLAYRRVGMADSAVACLKRAVSRNPEFSAGYANLSEVYYENGKSEWGLKFIRAALDFSTPSPAAVCNGIYRKLHDGAPVELKTLTVSTTETPYATAYNSLLWWLNKGEVSAASAVAQQLTTETSMPEAIILDAYLRFRTDSVEHAMSRAEFVARTYPQAAGNAYYALGVAFAGKKVPEMAQQYFAQAAAAGHVKAALYAATLNLDLGRPDSAQAALSRLRVQHQELWGDVSRELAILLNAYNQPVFAETEFPAANFTRNDRIRLALIADSSSRYVTALETFRTVLTTDSNDVAPYLELGKLYNKYGDSRAMETLQLGLKKAPKNAQLQLALADAYSQAGNTAGARKLCQPLLQDAAVAADARLLAARIALREGDRANGATLLKEAVKREPLHREAVLSLFNLSMETGDFETANRTVTQAVRTNTRNAELWAAYALISRQWGLSEDAGFGAAKAIELSTDPARKKELATAFAPELSGLAGKP